MNKIAGVKSSFVRQDLALHRKLKTFNDWKQNRQTGKEKPPLSKFKSHPRVFTDSESSKSASPVLTNRSSSSSIVRVQYVNDKFKNKIADNQNRSDKLNKDGKSSVEEENDDKEIVDKIFGGTTLNFLKNYEKKLKSKQTKNYVKEHCKKPSPRKGLQTRKMLAKTQTKKKIFSYKEELVDSVFEKKFKGLIEKSIYSLNDISTLLDDGIDEPDGDEDYSRRMKRVKEFSARFVRNYLYPLDQQIKDIENLNPKQLNINQRLVTCYQLISQAVQAYHNHLPTSVGKCASDKLNTLLDKVIKICNIHSGFVERPDENGHTDYIYALKVNVEKVIDKVTARFNSKSNESFAQSHPTKLNLTAKQSTKPSLKKKLQTRLSMYNSSAYFRQDLSFRRTLEQLARKKFNVKSRYKTATYKHRPPVEKPISVDLSKKDPKKVLSVTKSTPVITARIDDSVKTQVQVEEEKSWNKTLAENKGDMIHDGKAIRLLQLVQSNTSRKENEIETEEGKVKELLEICMKNKESKQILEELANELHHGKNQEEENADVRRYNSGCSVKSNASAKSRKEPTVTVSGAKNARLICIVDDNSITENEKSEEPLKKPEPPKSKKSQSSVRMNRATRILRPLQFLADSSAIDIIQYKLEFRKHCKQNALYMKTTNLQPWVLMGRLSDEILDYVVLEVAREIELNNIPEMVYNQEMQL